MRWLYSCIIAVSMYSKVPVPQVEWTDENMRHVMGCFPVTGLIAGLAEGLWLYLALKLWGLSQACAVLVGIALPVMITGGIHMDGFLDTMDAIHSYGDREKKLGILKDPHVGAFAVISEAVYLLLYGGALWECTEGILKSAEPLKACLFPAVFMVTERAFSGLSVVSFPSAKKDGLAASFSQKARKRTDRVLLLLWLAAALVLAFFLGGNGFGLRAVSIAGAQLLVFGWYYRMAVKEFGGVTGDLAGWFLQTGELAAWIVMAGGLKI